MNAYRARSFLLALPHVVETLQWGENLVFWVGDKAIGGKMCALLALDAGDGSRQHPVISFPAGVARYAELLEREDLLPAPYLARIFWVAALHWSALAHREWEELLAAAHSLTLAKLPARTRANLALPPAQQRRLIAERRLVLTQRKEAAGPRARRPPARRRRDPES